MAGPSVDPALEAAAADAPRAASATGSRIGKARRPGAFPALRQRNFSLFWTGQLVSLAGTWMQRLGQSWLVLELTGSPLALGTVSAMQFLPMTFLSLLAGPLVDRWPKRRILVATQSLMALLALALGVLAATGAVRYWMVLVLAFLLGLVNTVDVPARQAFMSEIAGREALVSAISLNSAAFNAARIVGPALSGLLVAAVGVAPSFLLNAASYLAVIGGLLAMRDLTPPPAAPGPLGARGTLSSALEGLRWTRARPEIALPLLLLAVLSAAVINYNVVVPILARDVLAQGAEGYGFLMSALGAGSLAAAVLMAAGGKREPTDRTLLAAACGMGLAYLALAFQRSFAVSAVLLALLGFSTVSLTARVNAAVQLRSDDAHRGRVMSLYALVFGGVTPVGALYAGGLIDAAGVPAYLLASGLVGLLATGGVFALGLGRKRPG